MYIDCEMTDSLLSRMLPDEDDAKYFCDDWAVDVQKLATFKRAMKVLWDLLSRRMRARFSFVVVDSFCCYIGVVFGLILGGNAK